MKTVIATTAAPGAIGPYSQAIEANGFVFVSGQIPLDPATGAFVPGGVEEQAEQSLKTSRPSSPARAARSATWSRPLFFSPTWARSPR